MHDSHDDEELFNAIFSATMETVMRAPDIGNLCPTCFFGGIIMSTVGSVLANDIMTDEQIENMRGRINTLIDDRKNIQQTMKMHQADVRNPQ